MADGPVSDPEPGQQPPGQAWHGEAGHAERHALSVASLLDDDLSEVERADAERLVATCPQCAGLHEDLVALAAATGALTVPARPRDFRLTADDAARLAWTTARDGEPRAGLTRLTGEMQVPATDHRAHDQLLVASLLDRSADHHERERATALVAACTDCATLHRDLVALRDASRALPTPPRPRDYELTAKDAQRLRRAGWRRLIAVFGSTRDAVSRPLAIGLTTIGLAGLLVTTVPGALPGATSTASLPTVGQAVGDAGTGANSESVPGSKAAPVPSAAPSAPGPAAAALNPSSAAPTSAAAPVVPSAVPAPTGEPGPSAGSFDTFVAAPAASAGAAGIAPAPDSSDLGQNLGRTAAPSLGEGAPAVDRLAPAILAGLLFASGLGLFVLRWAGRRI